MRFDKAVLVSAIACLFAVSPCLAQESVPTSPSAVPSAIYTYNRPFYAAADRADLAAFLEYRFLTTEGKANIWLRKQDTGMDFGGAVDGISRRDYEKEVSKRKPKIDAMVASGRVVVMNGQQVRVLLVAPPDMKAFNSFFLKGTANYIARGTALMPMRLVELLEGAGKGQRVWIAGPFSDRREASGPGEGVAPVNR